MKKPLRPSGAADGQTAQRPWPSYTMIEERIKKLYFEFYRETYKRTRLDRKTKELIAIAASVGFRCQGCLEGHIKKALKFGAAPREIGESIAIAMGVAAASAVDLTDIAASHLRLKLFE